MHTLQQEVLVKYQVFRNSDDFTWLTQSALISGKNWSTKELRHITFRPLRVCTLAWWRRVSTWPSRRHCRCWRSWSWRRTSPETCWLTWPGPVWWPRYITSRRSISLRWVVLDVFFCRSAVFNIKSVMSRSFLFLHGLWYLYRPNFR